MLSKYHISGLNSGMADQDVLIPSRLFHLFSHTQLFEHHDDVCIANNVSLPIPPLRQNINEQHVLSIADLSEGGYWWHISEECF